MNEVNKKWWGIYNDLATNEIAGNPATKSQIIIASRRVCEINVTPEAVKNAAATSSSANCKKIESWMKWFINFMETEGAYLVVNVEKLITATQIVALGMLLSSFFLGIQSNVSSISHDATIVILMFILIFLTLARFILAKLITQQKILVRVARLYLCAVKEIKAN